MARRNELRSKTGENVEQINRLASVFERLK
jgi:hypothetical protein